MEYIALTKENRRDLLKKRLLDYEITHFQAFCENELAKLQRISDLEASTKETLDHFEALIGWCQTHLSALED